MIESRTAVEEIRGGLLNYGVDVLLTKIPHFSDGCKSIILRILWFSRDARDTRPMNKMIGDLQGYHTSGDSSLADAILRLGQYYNVGHPLIEISGKAGEYYNSDGAAATRYLGARISDFAYDVYFKGINEESLQMIPTKNNDALEPKYLIPKIPMALVLGNLTVGMAFKSQVPMFDIAQVCKATIYFAQYYQSGQIGLPKSRDLAKFFIPSFPIKNNILNRGELLAAYKEGNYNVPIQMEGWVELSGNSVILRTMPYGTNFGKTVNEFRIMLKDPKCKYRAIVDSANDYSSNETEFVITFKSGKNPFEVLDNLRKVLKINDTLYPQFNYIKDDRVVELNPPSLTYMWYKERETNIGVSLNYTQSKLNAQLMRLNAILLVIDYSQDVLKIITESEDEDETVEKLVDRFTDLKLTYNQALIIARQPLSVFNRSSKTMLKNKLDQTILDLQTVIEDYSRIHQTIANDAAYIQKRYRSTTETVYSDDYLGYVQFGNLGAINFFTYDEMKNILSTKGWPSNIVKSIHLYDKQYPIKAIVKNNKLIVLQYVSKEINCERVVCLTNNSALSHTLVLSDKGNASVVNRVVGTIHAGYTLCPITQQFYAIHNNGAILIDDVSEYTQRKSISSGRQSTVIYGLPIYTKDVVVFYMNDEDPNQLHMSRILYGKNAQRIKFSPCGNTQIVGIFDTHAPDIILNIPKQCIKNIKLAHIFMHNLGAFFDAGGNSYYNINLSRGKSDIGVKLKQDTQVSTLFHMDFSSK